jgi:tetratricopeptide (TPR) repeat protein
MLMISPLASAAALNLTLPATTDGKIVLGLTWAATLLVAIMLLTALLPLLRQPPPGDGNEGQAPAWFRLFFAATCIGLGQAVMAIVWVLFQANSFSQSNLSAQYTPRGVVLIVALAGSLALFYDSSSNAVQRLARGQARLRGPFETPIIGLLTPTEERVCTAYGRMNGRIWFLIPFQILLAVGIIVLSRKGLYLDVWPLILPFLCCWAFALVAFLITNAALLRLNQRSLSAYCQELAALGRKWVDAVDGELRLEGLGLYQRLADLADAVGKERLLQQGSVEAAEAVAEARLVLAQASLEPGGEGVKDATHYLVGAVDLRDLKRGEWLGLGWLLASDYVPETLLKDRARYGHFLLSYCRAWIAAQRQLQQKTPLSAAIKTNVRLGLVVSALERRVCSLTPAAAGQQPADNAGNAARGEKTVPWRADTFLPDLAARPDVQLLLALNEAVVQLDGTLSWARVNAGLCRLAVGDAALARVHLEIAATQRRDDQTLPFYRAVAYAREQQSSEALALLEEVTARELGWFLVVRTYAETLLEVFQTPLVSTSATLSGQAVSAERWKRARSIIESALLEAEMQAKLQLPGAAPIYIAAGMAALFESRQPDQADVWFRRALGVDRQHALAWYGLALASWEQGNVDAALNAAQEAMRYQSPNVPAATFCAQILMVRGEMAPALAMAEQTLQVLSNPAVAQMRVVHYPRLSPERDILLRVKGRAAFEQGRFAEAFAALDQVVRRYIDARFFAACALFHLGRYAEATERLKDYLASKEGAQDSRANLYLGCALHAQGPQNLRAALNALDACLAGPNLGTPERLRALLERGQIYEERKQLDQAQRDYEAALEIERAPVTCYVLAALYHRSGRDQDAYDLLATVTGDALSAADQKIEAVSGGEAGGAAQPLSANTLVFMQPNEPVEVQIRRLQEILRQRLAESAARRLAEAAQQAVPEEEPPAVSEETPAADAPDDAPPPVETLATPRKAKRTSTKPKTDAKKAAPAEQNDDDMPTLSGEGVPAQIKRSKRDDSSGEE